MPCPPHAKVIGRSVMTTAEAQRRLVTGRAVFARSRGDCVVYWSHGDNAWVRVSPVAGGRVQVELVNASNCPC